MELTEDTTIPLVTDARGRRPDACWRAAVELADGTAATLRVTEHGRLAPDGRALLVTVLPDDSEAEATRFPTIQELDAIVKVCGLGAAWFLPLLIGTPEALARPGHGVELSEAGPVRPGVVT